jgi:ABC-type transport system involved in multi-copper enzyme maturation permease subunit
MHMGPIFRHELIRIARRRSHYAMRALLGLALLYVVWTFDPSGPAFLRSVPMRTGGGGTLPLQNATRLADLVFLDLAWIQGLAILLLVPGLTAGSIAEEDQSGTMHDLLASPLSSAAIVIGKLAARLFHVGIALAVGLVLVLPLALLRVLDAAIVAHAYAMLFTLAFFVGSLSLLVSVVGTRPRAAVSAAYVLVGGWLLLPIWLRRLVAGFKGPLAWISTVNNQVLMTLPWEAAGALWWIGWATLNGDRIGVGFAWSRLSTTFPQVVGMQLAVSVLCLLLAVLLLRPLRLGWRKRGRGHRWIQAAHSPVRTAIGDDPMRWKERCTAWHPQSRIARLLAILLGALVLVPLIGPTSSALHEQWESLHGDGSRIWARWSLNESLRNISAGLYILGLAAIAARAATSVTEERERGTWTSLATTMVTGREIVRAKIAGAVWGIRSMIVLFLLLWSIGMTVGSVHPVGAIAAAASLAVFAWYAAAVGVFCSSVAGTSERALVATFSVLLASNAFALMFVPLDLIGALGGSRQALFMAGVSPFVEWFALVSPIEIQQYLGGWPWEGRIELPFGVWSTRLRLEPGLIRTYMISLALHAIGALVAGRVAIVALDAARGEFPRPLEFLKHRPRNVRASDELKVLPVDLTT